MADGEDKPKVRVKEGYAGARKFIESDPRTTNKDRREVWEAFDQRDVQAARGMRRGGRRRGHRD